MALSSLFLLLLIPLSLNSCFADYDFIVVGGGTAGSVIATRLAETKHFDVLLLEAGGSPPPMSDIPAMFSCLLGSQYDWNYTTVPQSHGSQGLPNKKVKWPRGRMLGGSSSMNAMMHVRGNKNDFDNWDKLGASGWTWKDVLPYFKRAENHQADNSPLGKAGPIKITRNVVTEEKEAYIKALKDLGYDFVDFNTGTQVGVHYGYSAVHDGRRQSMATAYLEKVKHSSNLKIITHALVEKILFDETKRAIGVVFTKDAQSHTVKANKEIIVSGGAIGSPHILLLSGIGPKEHLESFGIPVVSDLPVGENLQDHPTVMGAVFTKKVDDILSEGELFKHYLLHKDGPLAHTHLTPSFVRTKYADPKIDWPDMQILMFPHRFANFDLRCVQNFYSTSDEVFDAYLKGLENRMGIFFVPNIMRPKSMGSVRLRSTSIQDQPLLDPRYLSQIEDLQVLAEGVKISYEIGQSEHFKKLGYEFNTNPVPGCENIPIATDDYWACLVKHHTVTLFHQSGTCRLGAANATDSVVDPELKVIGVTGLRVADASVMPLVVTGNTYATTVMIGEKVSDMIIKEYTP